MEKLNNDLIKSYKSAYYPDRSGKAVQLDVSKIWSDIKIDSGGNSDSVSARVKEWIKVWNNIDLDGIEIPKEVQRKTSGTPVISVSERL